MKIALNSMGTGTFYKKEVNTKNINNYFEEKMFLFTRNTKTIKTKF